MDKDQRGALILLRGAVAHQGLNTEPCSWESRVRVRVCLCVCVCVRVCGTYLVVHSVEETGDHREYSGLQSLHVVGQKTGCPPGRILYGRHDSTPPTDTRTHARTHAHTHTHTHAHTHTRLFFFVCESVQHSAHFRVTWIICSSLFALLCLTKLKLNYEVSLKMLFPSFSCCIFCVFFKCDRWTRQHTTTQYKRLASCQSTFQTAHTGISSCLWSHPRTM